MTLDFALSILCSALEYACPSRRSRVTSHDQGMLKCSSRPCNCGAGCGDAGSVIRLRMKRRTSCITQASQPHTVLDTHKLHTVLLSVITVALLLLLGAVSCTVVYCLRVLCPCLAFLGGTTLPQRLLTWWRLFGRFGLLLLLLLLLLILLLLLLLVTTTTNATISTCPIYLLATR